MVQRTPTPIVTVTATGSSMPLPIVTGTVANGVPVAVDVGVVAPVSVTAGVADTAAPMVVGVFDGVTAPVAVFALVGATVGVARSVVGVVAPAVAEAPGVRVGLDAPMGEAVVAGAGVVSLTVIVPVTLLTLSMW